MKRSALIVLFLILFTVFLSGNSEASLKLFVENSEVELKHPLVMINGNFMIPIWVFQEHLGAKIDSSANGMQIVFDDQTILMQLDVESAQVDGETYRLDVAPQLIEGEIVVPLRFIADRRGFSLIFDQDVMGLRVIRARESVSRFSSLFRETALMPEQESSSGPIIIHHPEENQDLKEIIFMGGPRSRVFIDLQSYTGYQPYLLTDPDRLVIDLYGVGGDALPMLEVHGDAVVKSIRSSRFDDQTMRIVFDLNGSTGYRVSPWPEGGLEVEFNYQLTYLEVVEEDGRFQLRFEASAAPVIETVYLEDPLRVVLDFQDTSSMIRSFDKVINQGRIARLRVSQHNPGVTRVVLQVTDPVTPLPLEKGAAGEFILPLFAGTVGEASSYLASLTKPPTLDLTDESPILDGVLSGLTVVVDPGHGGSDPGAIGFQGTFEKDVNLAIGLYLGEFLSQAGAKVVYTRDRDIYVSIFERPEIARQADADLYVSIHANAHIERGKARGTETLYRAKDLASEILARTVQNEVVKAITLADRRIWGRDDLAVFNQTKMPAILVEVGFLDHPDEEVLLRAPGFQRVAAQGIYNGIERFYLENKR